MEVPEDHFKYKDPGFCLIKILGKRLPFMQDFLISQEITL